MLKKVETEPSAKKESFLVKREQWMRYVINNDGIGIWARVVGISLVLRMSEAQPYAWPGQATIARDIGCTRATVNRAIGQLADKGLLIRTNKKMGADAKKDSRQFTYTIRLPFEF